MIKNICILGAGEMGSRITRRLLDADYNVRLYNRSQKNPILTDNTNIKYCNTPAAAVNNADLVISMLSDDNAAQSVWLDEKTGAITAMKKNAIALESSTLSVNFINKLGNIFKRKNIEFIDGPVVGSRPQAESGSLIYLAGGCKTTLNKIRPVLKHLSSTVHHTGQTGSGCIIKLAVNACFASQVALIGEVLGLLEKSGINKKHSVELLNQLPVTSPALQGIGNLIASDNTHPLFPIDLTVKDLSYVLQQANQLNAHMPATRTILASFRAAADNGYGKNNISGISQLYI